MCPACGDHSKKKKKCIESKTKWFSHSNIFDIKKLPAGTGPQGSGNVTAPTSKSTELAERMSVASVEILESEEEGSLSTL